MGENSVESLTWASANFDPGLGVGFYITKYTSTAFSSVFLSFLLKGFKRVVSKRYCIQAGQCTKSKPIEESVVGVNCSVVIQLSTLMLSLE